MYLFRKRKIRFSLLLISALWLTSTSLFAQTVQVFAGLDNAVCSDGALNLSILEASISGAVNDGTWLSSGDGVFYPDNSGNGTFSGSVEYVPGFLDHQIGGFELTLASNPDPMTGTVYTDQTYIHVLSDVQPFCNGSLNVSLDGHCETEITYSQLVVNPNEPVDLYQIILMDENGNYIPGNILNGDYIGRTIEYVVTHACSGQSCGGWITIDDHFVPNPVCSDTILSCLHESIPDSLGFPVVTDSIPYLIDDNTYFAENGDNCTNLTMHYHDKIDIQNCTSDYERILERMWTVYDDFGNTKHCTQYISLLRAELPDIQFPPNLDGIEEDVLSCDSDLAVDEDGNPHPSVSGMPDAMNCHFLESTYTDVTIDFCGATKKIIRTWHIIEWCSSETLTENQIIVTADTFAPIITCVDSVRIETSPYHCASDPSYITVPLVSDACSEFSIDLKILQEQQLLHAIYNIEEPYVQIPTLDLGTYDLHWIASDVCSNDSLCESTLIVYDNTAPFMVCLQETQVSLGDDGYVRLYPESVDNGSYDNCQLDSLLIRRADGGCNSGVAFSDYLDICCDDVGDTVLVELKAVDHVGMFNICEVLVFVDDKANPTIVCPPDLTISCTTWFGITDHSELGSVANSPEEAEDIYLFDAYNNGFVGTDGYFLDNCGAEVRDTLTESFECDEGLIKRTFIVTDYSGNIDSCSQYITVLNALPLTYQDIIWPDHVELDTCHNANLENSLFGVPEWNTGYCSMVSFTYDDQVFEFSTDACAKIIRHFSLIDWCQYDEITGAGLWTYEQVIKINNTVEPTFLTACDSFDLCIVGEDCGQRFTFNSSAIDDCTATADLEYSFEVDVDNDGDVDTTGLGSFFEYYLEPRELTVLWTVEDRCGNIAVCEQYFLAEDCKAPSPYCLSSVVTVIDLHEEAFIWTSDIDLGPSDNCSSPMDIQVSFSDTTQLDSIRFTCADIPNGVSETIMVDLWYTDEAGNQEYCTAEVVLQDPNNYCPNEQFTAEITGTILNSKGLGLNQVEVELEAFDEIYTQSTTSQNGEFAFDEVISEISYTMHFYREDSWLSGVSTLDIVRIQNHILGTIPLASAYDILAADVDGSSSVSGIDLVTIRKLILGKIEAFPNHINPWVFVEKDDELAVINPFALNTEVDVEVLEASQHYDIIACKLGDVNGSASVNVQNDEVESRSDLAMEYDRVELDGEFQYRFWFTEKQDLQGIQFALSTEKVLDIQDIYSPAFQGFGSDSYHIQNNEFRTSWNATEQIEISAFEHVLSFTSQDELDFELTNSIGPEIYLSDDAKPISGLHLTTRKEDEQDCDFIDNWVVNGNQLRLDVAVLNTSDIKFSLYSFNGQLVHKFWTPEVNNGQIILDFQDIVPQDGLYFIQAIFNDCSQNIQLPIIR